jgi:hypothetical protein
MDTITQKMAGTGWLGVCLFSFFPSSFQPAPNFPIAVAQAVLRDGSVMLGKRSGNVCVLFHICIFFAFSSCRWLGQFV